MAQTQKRFYYHGMEVRRLFYNGKEVLSAFRRKRIDNTDVFANLLIFYRDEDNCVKFSTTASGGMTLATSTGKKTWDGTMWYSTDRIDWTVWDGSEIRVLSDPESVIYVKGKGNTYVTNQAQYPWLTSADKVYGNLECLLDYQVVSEGRHPTMASYAFAYIFSDAGLTGDVRLPATTLTPYCYCMAFENTGIYVEELPATDVPEYAYSGMFLNNSSSFHDISSGNYYPEMKAKTLSTGSCSSMFGYCSNMKRVPSGMSSITTLGKESCSMMFDHCEAITQMPSLYGVYGTDLPYHCFYYMFTNCTNLPIYTYRYLGYQTPVKFSYPDWGQGNDPLSHMFQGTAGNVPETPKNATEYYSNSLVA